MSRYLVDSNVLSEPHKPNPNRQVVERLAAKRQSCVTASVVAYELLYGAASLPEGVRKRQLLLFYERMFTPVIGIPVLDYNFAAAKWQALEDARLRFLGLVRPMRDAQIAAISASQNLILVTRNTKDFEPYKNLKLENWFDT